MGSKLFNKLPAHLKKFLTKKCFRIQERTQRMAGGETFYVLEEFYAWSMTLSS
jgi:hypothetical protein